MERQACVVSLRTGERVIVRSTASSDAVLRLSFMRSVERTHMGNAEQSVSEDVGLVREIIADTAESSDALELAAFDRGRMVALGTLAPVNRFQKRMAHRAVIGIGVDRDYRGRGLGSAVVVLLLEAARTCGFEQVELEVSSENAAARRLYERLGFESCGRIPNALRFENGHYEDELRMVRKIEK